MRFPTRPDPPPTFTAARRVGRLVEARVFTLANEGHVRAYAAAFAPLIAAGRDRPVLCADHRPAGVYPPRVADSLAQLFASLNASWLRAALVVPPANATLAMQLQRIARESANDSRRVFQDPSGAIAFLGDALDTAERARLVDFLAEPVQ